MENRRIIDIHAHIYPEKIAHKAVCNIAHFYNVPENNAKGTPAHLLTLGQGYNVEYVVVNSVATAVQQVESINNFICDSAKNEPKFIAFATLHPDMQEAEIRAEIARVKAMGLCGIKLHPDCQRFKLTGARGHKLFSLIDADMPILVHTGDRRGSFSNPNLMAEIVKEFPHLRFIAAHFGGYSEWDKVACYKDIPNVYFDTSSSMRFMSKAQIKDIIDLMGVDRFMFGTDYPLWGYAEDIATLESLGLSEEDLDKIFYTNAYNFFNISNK
ncbi:MAG: amidohydrolase family protein [Bacillota bacterium]